MLDRIYDIDYDGYSDFFAQRKSDGDLYLYWGTGKGHGERVNICDNCDGITMTIPGGDYTSDGRTDMLIRTYTGELRYVARERRERTGFQWDPVGPGWNAMSTITGGHDYNSDGKDDLIAAHSTGNLYLYPGKGDGTFGSRALIGTGWNAMRDVTAVGDLDHNGHADLLAISSSDSCLYFYSGPATARSTPASRSAAAGRPTTRSPPSATSTATGTPTARRRTSTAPCSSTRATARAARSRSQSATAGTR